MGEQRKRPKVEQPTRLGFSGSVVPPSRGFPNRFPDRVLPGYRSPLTRAIDFIVSALRR